MTFQAPFPYFGGKSPVAPVVWQAFGDVPNYVEPFFGSGAVLLARPATHPWRNRTETVNDLDGMVANYWRATQAAPDDVARWADWPVNENDLHARHVWLVARKPELQARLEGEPDWYDAKVAGWWLWGMCQFIGSGWCSGEGPWQSVDGQLVRIGNDNDGIRRQRPHLGDGRGINRKRPHLGNDGRGINRKRPHLADDGMGINRQMVGYGDVSHTEVWSEHLRQMMRRLSDRLRRVRVCCG
ncbi:MAG: DNA adenine methylase, partial [SAR202 cluster bacterium]|nr:DNA adenine methylase [SAR202 cluster bacterium]